MAKGRPRDPFWVDFGVRFGLILDPFWILFGLILDLIGDTFLQNLGAFGSIWLYLAMCGLNRRISSAARERAQRAQRARG